MAAFFRHEFCKKPLQKNIQEILTVLGQEIIYLITSAKLSWSSHVIP